MLNDNVLILNGQWQPIGVSTVRKVVRKIFVGHANYIDMYLTPFVYDVRDAKAFLTSHLAREPNEADIAAHLNVPEEKVEAVFDDLSPAYTEHAIVENKLTGAASWLDLEAREAQSYIRCKRYMVVTPEIVICHSYKKMPRMKVKFSRQNILIRDEGRCQYCGVKVARRVNDDDDDMLKLLAYTWDHVVPRSQDGPHNWSNIVTSCMKCNNKKADKTLEETGMRLIKKPIEPNWNIELMRHVEKRPRSWDFFFAKEGAKENFVAASN
jgi:5-methylcytosine-specific restriction endonuclease McrA